MKTTYHLLVLGLQVHRPLEAVLGHVDQDPVVPEAEDDGVHDTPGVRERPVPEVQALEEDLAVSLGALGRAVPDHHSHEDILREHEVSCHLSLICSHSSCRSTFESCCSGLEDLNWSLSLSVSASSHQPSDVVGVT